ncbi:MULTISPECIES: adenosine deaminase [Brevibacterium]|jgi:adenosine deaminase|uniref:adenosine deaminase n=1 Tax=Brevibacterium sediminis TaxID=1857024 RepID=A0A5C4WTY6_9MICO|nr:MULTISPECIES: adenosine deaminase [Brevibacterium]MCS4593508.1 adenosine deaminase [Brevibacterium sediminis]MCU4295847.1 adenosine deaminase [Brevibacterium permense]TNM51677.1 adenosine deaminase [Brevibacterium sediminis]
MNVPAGVASDDPILQLPKVSLHDHLDGGLRPSTMLELADSIGHTLPASDAESLRRWFSESANSGDLVRYLETFSHTVAVMQSEDNLRRVAKEWVLDQVADGVFYAEARWAPEQHLEGGLELDAVVEAVQDGLEAGVSEAAAEGKYIRVGQLITAMRQADNSLAIAELAIRHREKGADSGVVGFDIAGPENGFPPSAHLSAFNALHQAYVPVTIHAGEAAGKESIHEAVTICHAQRLGHGARIVEDMDIVDGQGQLGSLAAWVLDQQIPLELCPSSNLQTDIGGTIASHPITGLKDLGFAVTINPDNRLMSGTSVSREMRLLVDEAGWNQTDLEWATVNAITAAFLPLDVRERMLDEILIPGFARVTI